MKDFMNMICLLNSENIFGSKVQNMLVSLIKDIVQEKESLSL